MNIDPWHLRSPLLEHRQWFKNLVEIHQITLEIQSQSTTTSSETGDSNDQLWALNVMARKQLDAAVEAQAINDALRNLESTVLKIQAETLSTNTLAFPILKKTCTILGQKCFIERWALLKQTPAGKQNDLRQILLCFKDSPFSGFPQGEGFFLKRSTTREIQVELPFCPHRHPHPKIKQVADLMCQLHSEWMLGFIQEFNPDIQLKYLIEKPRCIQRWSLVS